MPRTMITPEGAEITLYRFAQLGPNGTVMICIESTTDPDGINGAWVACPDTVGPDWTTPDSGATWLPPEPPVVAPPVWEWFIDLGPFYDRFGAAKMAVLTSTDAGVKAILADLSIRKWVDLKRADVAAALAYIVSVVPAVTSTLQGTILQTPVDPIENLALRKLYF